VVGTYPSDIAKPDFTYSRNNRRGLFVTSNPATLINVAHNLTRAMEPPNLALPAIFLHASPISAWQVIELLA
jgi:hypothetical protein